MKKLFAILLALMLVMASAVALAADGDPTPATAKTFEITKIYTVTDANTNTTPVVPNETITFTVTAVTADGHQNPTDQLLTVADLTVTSATASETGSKITVTAPAYTKAGVYKYTIKEVPPTSASQGVTYADSTEISVVVLVGYKTGENALEITEYFGVIKNNDKKEDSITNTFDLGGLKVTKTVKGNLADPAKKFPITITFTAANTVRNDITYAIGDGTAQTISAGEGWTGDKTVSIELAHNETVEFKEIPSGVTYKVEEKGTDSNPFTAIDSADTDPNDQTKYKPTYTAGEGTINTSIVEASILNEKDIEIPTGIELDVLPYVMIMVIALAGAALLVVRRRREQI